MRTIRMTCLSLGFTIGTAVFAGPAAATPCADFFPFLCLFGPEAQAMQPAPPVVGTFDALAQQPPRRRRVALRAAPTSEATAKKTEAPIEATAEKTEAPTTVAAKLEAEPVPTGIPELRLGPGPAFAMSLRLSPPMQEAVSPPTSACMIEQTFNQIFPTPEGLDRLAELRQQATPKPLILVAIKTGTAGAAGNAVSGGGVPAAATAGSEAHIE